MESAWLINFKNGNKIILTEKAYKIYEKQTPKENVQSEEHWFSMDECVKANPNVDVMIK